MINLFEIPATDQSLFYLGRIFGFVGNVLPAPNAPIIFGTIFRGINSIVLTVAAFIILYVTIVGVMKTATEGQFLGRQWSSLWLPIRMVVGIAALVPTASGYSAIQIVMMWVIIQGIGAADTIWTTVLRQTQVLGNPVAAPLSIPTVGIQNDMTNIFNALACQATSRISDPYKPKPGSNDGAYYCSGNPTKYCSMSENDLLNIVNNSTTTLQANKHKLTYNMGPGGVCGSMTFCDARSTCAETPQNETQQLTCEVCRAQQSALQQIVTTLGGIASGFALADLSYRKFYDVGAPPPQWVENYCAAKNISGPDKCCRKYTVPPEIAEQLGQTFNPNCAVTLDSGGDAVSAPDETVKELYQPFYIAPLSRNIDFITAALNRYIGTIDTAVVAHYQSRATPDEALTDEVLDRARQQGWIFAGAYYYYLAGRNNEALAAVSPDLETTAVDPTTSSSSFRIYRNNFKAANIISTIAAHSGATTAGGGAPAFNFSFPAEISDLGKIGSALGDGANGIMKAFMKLLTGQQPGAIVSNPISQLQNFGQIILEIAKLIISVVLSVFAVISLLGFIEVYVLGTGAANPVGPTISLFAVIFAPFFAIFISMLFAFGALLAVYTPLIPYIIFTMGAIAWFILVIEAMIAAPLVALGLMMPGGQSEVWGRAEGALMYAFALFLRPSLMIVGMIAAMLLSIVVITMINAAFLGVMGSISPRASLIEVIIFIGAYVGIVISALNKCFALIHIVPDRVLRWISGGEESLTGGVVSEGLGGGKAGVEGGAKAAMTAGTEMGGRAKQLAKDVGAYKKAVQEEKLAADKERQMKMSESKPPEKE